MTTSPISLLRNRNYIALLGGQIVSDFGTSVSQIAYPLLFLALTGSPAQAGLSIALTTLPTFLFGFAAGTVLDRFDRKQIMIACDILRFVVMGSIPVMFYFNLLTPWYLYLTAFLGGTGDVFFSTAEQTALSRVVNKDSLTQALGQYEASANTASLIGPIVGGWLYQIGRGLPFLVDAVSFLISALSLSFVSVSLQETKDTHKPQPTGKEIARGMVWLRSHPVLWPVTVVRSVGALVSGGQTLIIILLAKHLTDSTSATGLIFSIGVIGMIIGGLASDPILKRFGMQRSLIVTRWVIAIALIFQIIASNIWLLGLAAALAYGSVAVYGTIATAYRLELVPDELQGRVNSFHRMLAFGGLTIGGVLTGLLVEYISLNSALWLYVAILLILASVLPLYLRSTNRVTG